jgi:hypothetical protein
MKDAGLFLLAWDKSGGYYLGKKSSLMQIHVLMAKEQMLAEPSSS